MHSKFTSNTTIAIQSTFAQPSTFNFRHNTAQLQFNTSLLLDAKGTRFMDQSKLSIALQRINQSYASVYTKQRRSQKNCYWLHKRSCAILQTVQYNAYTQTHVQQQRGFDLWTKVTTDKTLKPPHRVSRMQSHHQSTRSFSAVHFTSFVPALTTRTYH